MSTLGRSGPAFLLALCSLVGCGGASGYYREARLSQPAQIVARSFAAEVARVYLTEETVTDGIADGTALVVELSIVNRGSAPYQLNPAQIWCLLQADTRHPEETRLFPPSVSGEGAFTGMVPEALELPVLDFAPAQARTFWVMFRGYRFRDADIPRRVTVTLPDPDGRTVELVLADPAQGYLRWHVAPTPSSFTFGVQSAALYGSYAQLQAVSTRLSRTARTRRFLWDIGITSTTFVQVKGELRSMSSSFGGTGIDLHLTAPLFSWGDPGYPIRLGPYVGAEAQVLVATEATQVQAMPTTPPIYGEISPQIGLEMDVGALKLASTPFPLVAEPHNPVPRWLFRLGYTHTWIGHGTADGYISGFRIAW